VSTAFFSVRQYITLFILHRPLTIPFSLSLPAFDVVKTESLDEVTVEAESYATLITGCYIIREIDTRSGTGTVINERSGTNRAREWSWYVDKQGRSKVV